MGNSLFKGPEADPSSLTLIWAFNTSLAGDLGENHTSNGWGHVVPSESLDSLGEPIVQQMSLFDRRPQAAVDKRPWMRYQNYLQKGLVDMGLRYGSRAS